MSEIIVGKLITELYKVREEIREINRGIKELELDKADLEERLIAAMDIQGTELSRNTIATASITEVIVPQVEDWDRYHRFILKNKALHLLDRRPAVVAFRELLIVRKGRPIPGVTSFKKRTVRLLTKTT